MIDRNKATRVAVGFVAFAAAALLATSASAQLLTKIETKCAGKVGKSAAKLAATIAKATAKCKDADISGKTPGSCPDTKGLTKIGKIEGKVTKSAQKSCGSVCSVHPDIPCMADTTCPPLANGAAEKCTAGPLFQPFDMGNMGFPGAFCEAAIGGSITSPDDLADCVNSLTSDTAGTLLDAIYGTITSASSVSADAAKCLAALSKATQKLSSTIYKGVVKCRDSLNKGKTTGNPATCTRDDVKLAAKIGKMEEKLRDTATKKCTDADILALDLCGSGATPLTTTEAADCLIAAAAEITDSDTAAGLRTYSGRSLVEAAYPPARGVCGDGTVNQIPSAFALLGEECDGADDSACPGQCLPPGDLYECTCGDVKRVRYMADGITADLDNGWTGKSHEQGVADLSAHIYTLQNCDCSQLDPNGVTCVGSSADSVCDIVSNFQLPTCSWEPHSGTKCDDRATNPPSLGGTKDGSNKDEDCAICDSFSTNAGDYCLDNNDCNSQCYDANGVPSTACVSQDDCSSGAICRGRCDTSQTCLIMPNGAPLPISSGGTAVCILSDYRVDVNGTMDIVSGQEARNEMLFSKVHLGVNNLLPCPVCGGFCNNTGTVCEGTCSTTTATSCRFDSDCPSGETCTSSSPQCPVGDFCNLSLACRAGPNDGEACRIEAATRDFGTTSHDCVPDPGFNISGEGLEINYLPLTSETVSLPNVVPCTNVAFKLFDCPCPFDGGRATQPNDCAAACNAGAEAGTGCGTGDHQNGLFTSCAGGTNGGFACDEDADCPGSACSANPTHCVGTGDPALELNGCSTNGDCGAGTCQDACPSGRCVPLCSPLVGDPDDGICAAGPPVYHCNGAHNEFIVCFVDQANGTCDATCSVSGSPCVLQSDCPSGETCGGTCDQARLCEAGNDGIIGTVDDHPGAGICVSDERDCFLENITATGGGPGTTPTNPFSVAAFCIGATGNGAINSTAGLGGPGRIREFATNVTNGFTSLP